MLAVSFRAELIVGKGREGEGGAHISLEAILTIIGAARSSSLSSVCMNDLYKEFYYSL